MDLGHHRGVDEPRDIEEAVVVPVGVGLVQHVADGVVLAHEKGVQHRKPTHQLRVKPVSSMPFPSTGSVPSLFNVILPSRPLRRRSCVAWSLP